MHWQPYRLIPLMGRNGRCRGMTLVDIEDYDAARGHRWHLSTGYAVRLEKTDGYAVAMPLHRLILGLDPSNPLHTDHINRDRLDNRRENLRAVTHAENMRNKPSANGSSSRYRGVRWQRDKQRWRSEIKVEGRKVFLGYFDAEEDAGHAVRCHLASIGWPCD